VITQNINGCMHTLTMKMLNHHRLLSLKMQLFNLLNKTMMLTMHNTRIRTTDDYQQGSTAADMSCNGTASSQITINEDALTIGEGTQCRNSNEVLDVRNRCKEKQQWRITTKTRSQTTSATIWALGLEATIKHREGAEEFWPQTTAIANYEHNQKFQQNNCPQPIKRSLCNSMYSKIKTLCSCHQMKTACIFLYPDPNRQRQPSNQGHHSNQEHPSTAQVRQRQQEQAHQHTHHMHLQPLTKTAVEDEPDPNTTHRQRWSAKQKSPRLQVIRPASVPKAIHMGKISTEKQLLAAAMPTKPALNYEQQQPSAVCARSSQASWITFCKAVECHHTCELNATSKFHLFIDHKRTTETHAQQHPTATAWHWSLNHSRCPARGQRCKKRLQSLKSNRVKARIIAGRQIGLIQRYKLLGLDQYRPLISRQHSITLRWNATSNEVTKADNQWEQYHHVIHTEIITSLTVPVTAVYAANETFRSNARPHRKGNAPTSNHRHADVCV
jgi:hypothetical protein